MPPNAPAFDWNRLKRVAPRFALGVEGAAVPLDLIQTLLDHAGADRSLLPLAAALAFWRWQARPLCPAAADLARRLDAFAPSLAPAASRVLEAVAALAAGEDAAPLDPEADAPAAVAHALAGAADPGVFPWRLAKAWELLAEAGDFETLRELPARGAWPGVLAPIADFLAAEAAFLADAPGQALEKLAGVAPALFGQRAALLRGQSLMAMGRGEEGRALLAGLARRLPWHVNLVLCLRACDDAPRPGDLAEPTDAVVLLYAWNNARLLGETLENLFATDLGDSPVLCLDNGSTDATPEVLARAAAKYGPDRLTVVRLPVNVGAPAARNWLLSLPRVRERAFAAFVDDDVLLEKDWLARLRAALDRHPLAGAAGARVVDAARPRLPQSVDAHILPPEPGSPERFTFFDPLTGAPDVGLFAYERPCLSVTGCCHLLRRSALEHAGGFDIRFTPSQLDDFERDLRSFAAGFPCVYDGRVRVRHHRRTGGSVAASPARLANALGNRVKLEGLYAPERLREIMEADLTLAWDDLLTKTGAGS